MWNICFREIGFTGYQKIESFMLIWEQLSLKYIYIFLNQPAILIFIPYMTYFKTKKILLSERPFWTFLFVSGISRNRQVKNIFSIIALEFYSQSKNTWLIVNF